MPPAVVTSVSLRGDRIFVRFRVADGREVALGLNFPPDRASCERWARLAAATGRRLPADLGLLAGASVRLELIGSRIGRIFSASGDPVPSPHIAVRKADAG